MLAEGDIGGFFSMGIGGALNQATGVADEAARQRQQAEIDLARFDAQYGGQLGLGAAAFSTPETEATGFFGDTGTLAALSQLVEATQMVAKNTAPSTGPSMEAGLS
jgi:hypothetical protein